jgi:aminoglycoside 3-N-acetyltransferase
VEYEDVVLDDGDFEDIGTYLERNLPVTRGPVGRAESRLLSMYEAVDYATAWMNDRRV